MSAQSNMFRQVIGGTVPAVKDPILAFAIEDAARRTGVPHALLMSVAWHESRYKVHAVSPVGARGVFQLMPNTAAALQVDPMNPVEAAYGAAKLLDRWWRKYSHDWAGALAAYVWGPGNVDRAAKHDTKDWPPKVYTYVHRVLEGAGMPVPFAYNVATPDGLVMVG